MPSELLTTFPGSVNFTIAPLEAVPGLGTAVASPFDLANADRFRFGSSSTFLPSGVFTVGRTGQVELDYLLDGGAYKGELGVFSLSGLSNTLNTTDLIQEAARRALSNSELGYVVISDPTEAAKFSGTLPGETQDWNTGIYQGIKTLNLRPGDQFGVMLVPHSTVQQVLDDPTELGDRPLFSFSLGTSNTAQLADLTGDGSAFTFEDLSLANGSDRDYNDLSFQIIGATGSAVPLDNLQIDSNQNWRQTSLGEDVHAYIETRLLQETISLQGLTSGVFTVNSTGQVGIDYLFDGGGYQGELAIFSLEGLDQHDWKLADLIQETARRALSDSVLGYVAIADRTEGARFTGLKPGEGEDWNEGIYQGVKTLAMKPGSKFGVMLVPNGTVQQVFNDPTVRGDLRPLFSIAPANPKGAFHLGQIADVTGAGNTFTMEDLRVDKGSDRDYNDIVFQVRGAIGQAGLLDQYIDSQKDWRTSNLGQTLIEYTRPYVTPSNLRVGETISETTLEILNAAAISDSSLTLPTVIISQVQPFVQSWLDEAKNKLAELSISGNSAVNSFDRAIAEFKSIAANQSTELNIEILGNQDHMNAWANYLDNQLTQSGQYANSRLNYLSDYISGVQSEMRSQLDEMQATISGQGSYLEEWRNYLNGEITGTGKYLYDWAAYASNETNRVVNWVQSWTDYADNEIDRVNAWMVDRVNDLWNSFNNGNVGNDAWRQYDSVKNYRVSTSNDAWNRYDDLVGSKNTIQDNAVNTFNFWDAYRIRAIDHAWLTYNDFSRYITQVLSDAWGSYSSLDSYRNSVIGNAWDQYDRSWAELFSIFANAQQQRDQLRNYIDKEIGDAWQQSSLMRNYAQNVASNAQKQADTLERSWIDWAGDSSALTEVLAKIAASNSVWYTQPEKLFKLPLIGLIDTGFSANNPDINYSRITLGSDFVARDSNPLLEPLEENGQSNHGTQMLEIIAASRSNNIGIDGLNDKSPLWLGRAIGSHDWAQSLVEFVDAVKASGQPNAVVNLSFDLTQTNPDGSTTTRNELTALERAALTYAQQQQVLIVVPTGNQNTVGSALTQATKEFDNVFVVGAADGQQRADYSSYTTVDYTNYGKGLDILAQGTADNGAVGSSVAAAKVSGAASLVWAANPNLSYSQIMDILRRTATDLNSPNWDTETGLGLLNIEAAVNLAQATQSETYRPANFDLIQETLKANAVPESSWQDFYKLYDYYNLEAKLSGTTWDGMGSAIASERPAWSWKGAAVGAGVGAVFGAPVVGAVVGGLLGSGSGGSGSSSGGLSPDQIKKAVGSARDHISNAGEVLAQVTRDTGSALSNAGSFSKELGDKFGSEIGNGDNFLTDIANDAWTAAQSTAKTLGEAADVTGSAFVAGANALGAAGQSTLNTAKNIGNQVSSWVRDAWSETQSAVSSVHQSLNQGWDKIQDAANKFSDQIPKSIGDLKKLGKEFENFLDDNNPVKKLADDLAGKLKSTLSSVDVGAVVDALKRIPVVGTAVSGLEGLYYLAKGDWKEVLKAAVDGALAFYGMSNTPGLGPKFISLYIDVSWELKDEKYKEALSAALSNFGVKRQISDVFVNSAWAMKNGNWQGVLDAGLSGAGFNNARQFVDMAWGAIDNKPENVLNAAFQVAGLDKLGVNQAKANAFVQSALALKDNNVNQVADQLLSVAGTQAAQMTNSAWVKALKDSDPSNDRAAVTQGLSAVGFQNVNDWVGMAWAVKDQNYLQAASTVFSLAKFAQGQDWVSMAEDLQKQNYLDALSTGFKAAGFAKGENLAKAAIALRQGNPLTAFFEGLSLVDGVGELVDAFKALKDGNAKAGVPLMIQAAPKLALRIGT